ncbi:unnamed protein product [Prorocentrum cordatum]|uniref:FACT complex subunit n=1 Tax=Prorocentrum cordatum TaxID=2364126 RepID=A0ABN9SMA6_9DINO|nr:unnamed protein product [Polarella glacialis]
MALVSTASKAGAEVALRGYAKQGFDADSTNPEHIQAYLILRQTHRRVKPDTFVNYMKRKETHFEHGGRVKEEVWGVPKVNFPNGLPQDMQKSEMTPEKLAELALVGGGAPDHETYFFIDQECERKTLGQGVKTVEFFWKSSTRMPSDAVAGPSIASGAGSPGEVRSPQQDSGAGAGEPNLKAAVGARENPLKRHSSDEADGEAPAAKKARLRLETLRTLRDNIKSAVQAGHWKSQNALHTATVDVYIEEAKAILKELSLEADAKEVGLVTKFTNFPARTFLAAPAFEHLHIFKGTFTKLKELGGQETGEGKLLEALAVIAASSDAVPDWSQADPVARAAFRGSAMYRSFVAARVGDKVRKAQSEEGQKRLDILLECSEVPNVPPAIKMTIDSAVVLFDVRVPLGMRIKHFVLSPQAVKLARNWDPEGLMGAAALFLMETPNVKDMTFDRFVEVARAVAEEGIDVPNPVLKSAVGFVKAVSPTAPQAGQEWAHRLVQEGLTARLQLKVGAVEGDFDPVAAVPAASAADAFRATKEFLSFLPKGVTVAWLQAWKKHRDEEKDKAKQARADAKDAKDAEKGAEVKASEKGAEGKAVEKGAEGKASPASEKSGAADAQGGHKEQPQEVQKFKIGDVVIGKSHQHKEKYNDVEAQVTDVLTRHYKVKLLTGTAANTSNDIHKYLFKDVRAKPSGGGVLGKLAAPAGADKAAAPAGMQNLADLFDE